MHYPVMTEKQVAARWKVSLKTLGRWRLYNEGPVWHRLFHHVRYDEYDILAFEYRSAQHWVGNLSDGESMPRVVSHPPKNTDDSQVPDATEPAVKYVSANHVIEATGLPGYLFTDRAERERRRVPYLLLVGNLRFSLQAILQWEIANSVLGFAPEAAVPIPGVVVEEGQASTPVRVQRWYEVVKEQTGKRFNSAQ